MSSLISSAQILEEVGGFPKGRWHAVLHLKPTRFFDDLLREDAYGAASEYMKGLVSFRPSLRQTQNSANSDFCTQADECHLAEPSANGKRPTPMETLRKYQYITFLDPTNSEARLNAASLRLVLADDRDNVIQSVLLPSHSASDSTTYVSFAAGLERFTTVPPRCTTARRAGKPTIDVGTHSLISSCGTRRSRVRLYFSLSFRSLIAICGADYKRALVIEPGNVRLKQCMDAAKRRVAVE